ncbi:hypothetical protein E3226_006960 [Legionella geestiana]|uniref:ankyrin repeat domain-containing protein n=1 Tax=Legionella geestiana TaxID=45065 RepID=UPI001091D2C9|nr:ankyrin repeat domain-containing protein [Legionella geestiana]QDQ40160.1 hypothetical protein E3226_006960 [Legionella geestiana]
MIGMVCVMFFSHSVDRHTLALCKTLFSSDPALIGKILAHYAIFNNDSDFQANFNRALQKLATGLSKKAEKLELQLDDITNADKLNVLFLRAWLVEDCPSLWLDDEKNIHPTFINLLVHLASSSDFHAKSPLSSRQGFSLYQTLDLNITALGKSLPMVERAIWMRLSQIPGIDFNESNNYWGNTSLHFKISNGQSEDTIRFIRNILTLPSERSRPRLDVNRLSTGFGTSPLHLAVAKGYRDTDSRNVPVLSYVSLVKELCEAGADTNLKTAPVLCQEISQKFFLKPLAIQAEFTALHIACARRDLELIAILLEYSANLTIRNADGLTPIDVLQLPYENRKCIVDSISGPGLNNFETYEQEHSSESHLAACYQLLHDATTSRQSHCSLSNG